ncbi:hypothetical protein ACH47B_26455 [Rhodococcus sp. NPDC019627]|uniref:hypothetical protein n=1 Tax=unclassified Rhodococcus (in: high G+C Gram-positive bacteria) TaxID=192944 RepID=UPI00340C5562
MPRPLLLRAGAASAVIVAACPSVVTDVSKPCREGCVPPVIGEIRQRGSAAGGTTAQPGELLRSRGNYCAAGELLRGRAVQTEAKGLSGSSGSSISSSSSPKNAPVQDPEEEPVRARRREVLERAQHPQGPALSQ